MCHHMHTQLTVRIQIDLEIAFLTTTEYRHFKYLTSIISIQLRILQINITEL